MTSHDKNKTQGVWPQSPHSTYSQEQAAAEEPQKMKCRNPMQCKAMEALSCGSKGVARGDHEACKKQLRNSHTIWSRPGKNAATRQPNKKCVNKKTRTEESKLV